MREIFVNGIETPVIHAQIGEQNLDFQPLLIEDAGDNFEDEAPNEEENEHDEGLVWEDEVPEGEVPNEDVPKEEDTTSAPREPLNLEPEELRRRGVTRARSEEYSDKCGLDLL